MENVRRLSPIGILPVYLLKLGVWGRLARPKLTLHWWIIFSSLLSNVYSPNIVSNGSLVVVVVVVLLWYLHLFLSQLEYKDCSSHTAAKWPPDVNKQINCCLSSVSSSIAKVPEVKWKKFVQILSDFTYRSASVSLLHATQYSESCGLQIGCIEQLCCNNTHLLCGKQHHWFPLAILLYTVVTFEYLMYSNVMLDEYFLYFRHH